VIGCLAHSVWCARGGAGEWAEFATDPWSLCGPSRDQVIKPASDSPSTSELLRRNVPFWNRPRARRRHFELNLTTKWAEPNKTAGRFRKPGIASVLRWM